MTGSHVPKSIGWTDQHGDRCNVYIGDAADYASPLDGPLADDVVGVIESKAHSEETWTSVYLPLKEARAIHAALGALLALTWPMAQITKSGPPRWPYQMYWCDACCEPSDNSAIHDVHSDPPGCGGPVSIYVVGPVTTVHGTNGREWKLSPAFSTSGACPACRGVGDQRVVAWEGTDAPCHTCGGRCLDPACPHLPSTQQTPEEGR